VELTIVFQFVRLCPVNKKRESTGELPSLSRTEELVLRMLVVGGEQYGLQLVDASGGALKRGTVYVLLNRMEEKGFIESRPDETSSPDAQMPRRLYRATGLGERVFRAWSAARAVMAGKLLWEPT
jgi:PadR family transcriptional regulator, regulatory protein PadR